MAKPLSTVAPITRDSRPLGLKVRLKSPSSTRVYEGFLEHFIPAEACILVDHHFKRDTTLLVDVNGFQFEGIVAFCGRKNDVYEAHIVIPDTDETGRRRDPRYVVNLPARVYAAVSEQPFDAMVVDISRDGLGLECPLQLEMGDTLAVESQLNLAFGVVRHCRALPCGRFRAGVLVHNVISKKQNSERQQDRRSWVRSLFS